MENKNQPKIILALILIVGIVTILNNRIQSKIILTLNQEVDFAEEVENFNFVYKQNAKLKQIGERTYQLGFKESLGTPDNWKYKELFEYLTNKDNTNYPVQVEVLAAYGQPGTDQYQEQIVSGTLLTEEGSYFSWLDKTKDPGMVIYAYNVPISFSVPWITYSKKTTYQTTIKNFENAQEGIEIDYYLEGKMSFVFDKEKKQEALANGAHESGRIIKAQELGKNNSSMDFKSLVFFPKLSTYLDEVRFVP